MREAAVVGLLDDTWGEVVHAVVATSAPVDEDELIDFVRDCLAGYKRPRGVTIWDELPKSGAGKILRREVRDRVRSRTAPPG